MEACRADLLLTTRKCSKIDAKMTGWRAKWLLGLAAGVGMLAACGPEARGPFGSRQAIEATVARYVAASNQGDADALAALYTDDAMLLPPDHEPIKGRVAIGQFWHQGTDEGLEVTTLRLEVSGDLAYLVGRYRLPATEEEPADSGQSVLCLKRQRDGSWKVTTDIWNSGSDGEDDDTTAAPGPSIS
jgi:uncharacterized protein (TIGR02246 family)